MTKKCCLFILLIELVINSFLAAQDSNRSYNIKSIGIPFMTEYGPSEYKFSNQNFAVLVGDDQRIYFGNDYGILVYDGNNWTRLKLPKAGAVYSLAKGKDGTIYVGAVNDMGYLKNGINGKLEYVSLREKLEQKNAESYISKAHAVGELVFFTTNTEILIFDPVTEKFTMSNTPGDGYSMYIKGLSVYTYARDSLFQLQGKQWKAIRKSILADKMQVGSALLVDLNQRGIIINRDGFFDFNTEKEIAIPRTTKAFIEDSTVLYSASLLKGKYIALSTWSGLLITDLDGNPIQLLNKAKGLPDDFLFGSVLDNSGSLWVATNNGIAKIELFSPFSIFDERMGIDEIISDIKLYQENLYLSTPTGVYRSSWDNLHHKVFTLPVFEKISSGISSGFLKTENSLIVLMEKFPNLVIENETINEIEGTADQIFWTGFKYHNSEDLILGSLKGKMLHLAKKQSVWKVKKESDPGFLIANYMAEGKDGGIWVSSLNEGVFRLEYDKKTATIKSEKKYGKAEGLPSNHGNYLYSILSKLYFATSKGIYKYNSDNDRFIKDPQFSNTVGESPVSLLTNDSNGNIYYFSDELNVLRKSESNYVKSTLPNTDFIKYSPTSLTAIDSANLVIGSLNNFIHVDPTQVDVSSNFQVNISSINSINSDSTYFHGFGPIPDIIQFSATENAIRIAFSASFYQHTEQTLYRWRLKEMNSNWSSWTHETHKDYTNLKHGRYAFEVMAKNSHAQESRPVIINFIIDTPWFLTPLAYLLYLVLGFIFIWLIINVYTRKLRADRERLERIVEDRTTEIREQKKKVEESVEVISNQRDKLVQMDELKSKFFLNISHELRTPLTLTMGNVDQTLKGQFGPINDQQFDSLNTSYRNSQRLLKMVNNILDISKLEGGKLKLQASKSRPSDILAKVVGFFSSKFFDKNIELKSDFQNDTELYIDRDKFETIFINLIANAFKFTSDGGAIAIELQEGENSVTISVKDNGVGIPAENIPFVFDRFYQNPHGTSDEGTGLGLALTKELVALHSGDISIKSEAQQGTEFIVVFQKGLDHLSHNQIIDIPQDNDLRTMDNKYPLADAIRKVTFPILEEKKADNGKEKPHILIVEDNPEMTHYISGLLSEEHRLSLAENGLEGLNALKKEKPDLILTDWLMPEMDGYEMAQEIKKDENLRFIPMIFLTARAQEQDKMNVLNLGIDDYLYKPFNADELKIRIRNLLHNKEERSEFITQESIDPEDIEWKDFGSTLKLKLDQYIESHIKEEIEGDELAESFGHSKRTIYRKIKINTGLSLNQYIKEYRLRKARNMLENNEFHTVSEVSYAVGFNYLSYFTKSYKERFGKQPSEYLE